MTLLFCIFLVESQGLAHLPLSKVLVGHPEYEVTGGSIVSKVRDLEGKDEAVLACLKIGMCFSNATEKA
ncbi:hypothetical protein Bca52824_055065 [Brassica carinata]|uniref:Uncharacterized protein n=1 Tax=Brassica carinata TaxID=52824 RepID=A0A8X7UL28_BRACI|nr:hypothetical protein Bca52824_055065 [Brassica carinata]